jgi:hypothetical protein
MIDATTIRTELEALTLAALHDFEFAIAPAPLPFPRPSNEHQVVLARSVPWGSQLIVQTMIRFDDGWSIGLWYGVRVEWVQAICDQLPEPAGYDIAGGTIWGLSTIGPMLGQSYIFSARELRNWVATMLKAVRADAFPFFNRLASVPMVEAEVNADPAPTLGMETESRYIKGMLLARAVAAPQFEVVQSRYRIACQASWGAIVATYDEAVRCARAASLPSDGSLTANAPLLPVPASDQTPDENAGPQLLRTTSVTGFDASGEPEIREYSDGSVEILFEFMPPLNGSTAPSSDSRFDRFEDELSTAVQQRVLRDDRERFVVPAARPDVAALAYGFLVSFWRPPGAA